MSSKSIIGAAPLPWHYRAGVIQTSDGSPVADLRFGTARKEWEANGLLILTANSYEPMREALKRAVIEFDNFFAMVKGEIPSWMDDDHNYWKALEALDHIRELVPDLVTSTASSTEIKP